MSNSIKAFVRTTAASVTMASTVLSLAGFAAFAPVTAYAVAPADFGLTEGNTIRATGDVDIFIVNGMGYKRLFVNPAIFSLYGHLSWAGVKEVSPSVRDAFGTSAYFTNAEAGDGKVYSLECVSSDVATLHWLNLTGAQAVAQDANFFSKVFNINNAEQALYGVGSTYTSLGASSNCAAAGPTPSTSGGPLQGGAGSLDKATFISSLNNEEVGEAENNIAVAGLNLGADNGSDLRLISAKLLFDYTGADSTKLADYADEVQLWVGSTKVATVDVADFNKDAAGLYSKSVSLTGDGIIPMDSEVQMKVSVSAIDSFDSANIPGDWDVSFESIRYVDAEGAITSDTSTDNITDPRSFMFVDFQTASDLELKLSEATSTNPEDGVVETDADTGTNGVLLLSGTLKATGSDFTISQMDVDFTSVASDVDAIAAGFTLEIDGNEVDSVDATTDCGVSGTSMTCPFDDIDDVPVNEGDSVSVKVFADLNGTNDTAEGNSLQATLDNSNTVADDQNGDSVAGGDLPGTVNGGTLTFYSEGIDATVTSITESKDNDGNGTDTGTYVFKFKVTAFGSDAHVDSSSACSGIGYTVDDNGDTFSSSCSLTSTADEDSPGEWLVSDGNSEDFTVTVAVVGAASGDDNFVTIHLDGVDYFTDNTASTLDVAGLDAWESDAQYLTTL